jgi:hypothetical protein
MAKTEWVQDAERSWPEYEGELDAALASLRESDRKAVVLRFYEHKSFDEIAVILGTAEEAARKRVSRAVEKLRGYFGVSSRTLPATMITYFLYHKLTTQAPAGLAGRVTAAALKPASTLGAGSTAHEVARQITQQMAVSKATWVISGVAAAVLMCALGGFAVFSSLAPQPPGAAHAVTSGHLDTQNR